MHVFGLNTVADRRNTGLHIALPTEGHKHFFAVIRVLDDVREEDRRVKESRTRRRCRTDLVIALLRFHTVDIVAQLLSFFLRHRDRLVAVRTLRRQTHRPGVIVFLETRQHADLVPPDSKDKRNIQGYVLGLPKTLAQAMVFTSGSGEQGVRPGIIHFAVQVVIAQELYLVVGVGHAVVSGDDIHAEPLHRLDMKGDLRFPVRCEE